MAEYVYSLEMQVRDYELDAEGIVNNANYLHYLEHTRHQFCCEYGISFAEMHKEEVVIADKKEASSISGKSALSDNACARAGRPSSP